MALRPRSSAGYADTWDEGQRLPIRRSVSRPRSYCQPVLSQVSIDRAVHASFLRLCGKLPPVMDVSALRVLLLIITGWLDRREREMPAYLIEENRVLRRQVGGRRLWLTDDDRRKLAARAHRLGRQALRQVATLVTPDTLRAGTGSSSPGSGP